MPARSLAALPSAPDWWSSPQSSGEAEPDDAVAEAGLAAASPPAT